MLWVGKLAPATRQRVRSPPQTLTQYAQSLFPQTQLTAAN